MTAPAYNPRYLAYCKAHGAFSPETMKARDRGRWKGDTMAGFILWLSGRWQVWCKLRGYNIYKTLTYAHAHDDFDRWLQSETHPEVTL